MLAASKMTSPVVVSPKIVKLKWGSILVQAVDEAGHLVPGEVTKYRDAKLWPGGSRAWIWKVHGEHFVSLFHDFNYHESSRIMRRTIIN